MRISRQGIETEWHGGCKVVFGLVGVCFAISTAIRGIGLIYSLISSGDRLGVLNQYGFKFGRDLVTSVVLNKVAKQFCPLRPVVAAPGDQDRFMGPPNNVRWSRRRHQAGIHHNELRTATVDGWLSGMNRMRGVSNFLDRLAKRNIRDVDGAFVDLMINGVKQTLELLQESKNSEFVQSVLQEWGAIGNKRGATAQEYGGVVYWTYVRVRARHVASAKTRGLKEKLQVANRARLVDVIRRSTSDWSKFLGVCMAVGESLNFPKQELLFGGQNFNDGAAVFDATERKAVIDWFVQAFKVESPLIDFMALRSACLFKGYTKGEDALRSSVEQVLEENGLLEPSKKNSPGVAKASDASEEWECACCFGEGKEMVRPSGADGALWHRACVLDWVRKQGTNPVTFANMTAKQVNALTAVVRGED